MPINREDGPLKWNLNSILAVGGAAVTVVTQIVVFAILWTNQSRDIADVRSQTSSINLRLDKETDDRKDRIKDFTKTLTDMQTQIAGYTPLSYQVTQAITLGTENKEANKQTNVRIDRVVESIGNKIDNLAVSVNELSKNVAVLAIQQGKPQKTSLSPLELKP